MNEEMLNRIVADINESLATEIGSVFDEDTMRRNLADEIESALNDVVSDIAREAAHEVIREWDYESLMSEIDVESIIKKHVESFDVTSSAGFEYVPNAFGAIQYQGKLPENVSQLIDAIICLTADDATVLQFFNRIATLREYALALKNKQ